MSKSIFIGMSMLLAAVALATAATAEDRTNGAGSAGEDRTWQPGQVMDFQVVDADTGEGIPEVTLELQNMGQGIDFQDVKIQTTDAQGLIEDPASRFAADGRPGLPNQERLCSAASLLSGRAMAGDAPVDHDSNAPRQGLRRNRSRRSR